MKNKTLALLAGVALLAAAGFAWAQVQDQGRAQSDPRLDKVIEQNEQIMKNQQEILKTLGELKQDLLQLRRRSS